MAIGTAIPREANDSASGTAAVKKGSEARTKAKEYISSRTLKHLIGARCSNTDHRMDLRKYRAIPPGFLYFWRIRFSASRRILYGHIAHVGMLLGLDVVENGLYHGYV